ncbi:hypothetical protein VdG2_08953 [Verticillium dahliae VDG2]|nr:hypothetical protein VdG2_08953 [Verticillium dahliae VDG2]
MPSRNQANRPPITRSSPRSATNYRSLRLSRQERETGSLIMPWCWILHWPPPIIAPTFNKFFIYKKVPEGLPIAGQDLVVEDRPINLENAPLYSSILVEVLYSSFDPYIYGRIRDPKVKSYSPPFELDASLRPRLAYRERLRRKGSPL